MMHGIRNKLWVVAILFLLVSCVPLEPVPVAPTANEDAIKALGFQDTTVEQKFRDYWNNKPLNKAFAMDPFNHAISARSWGYGTKEEAIEHALELRPSTILVAVNNDIVWQDELKRHLDSPIARARQTFIDNKLEETRYYLKMAEKQAAGDWRLLYYVGWIYQALKEDDKAISFFRNSLALKDNFLSRYRLSTIYLEREEWDNAKYELDIIQRSHPNDNNDPDVQQNWYVYHLAMGNYWAVAKMETHKTLLGFQYQNLDGKCQIVNVYKGSPSDLSGLAVGDVILTVNGETTDCTTNDAGAEFWKKYTYGALLTLEILRDGKVYTTEVIRGTTTDLAIRSSRLNTIASTSKPSRPQPQAARPTPHTVKGKRVALVIGNGNYRNAPLRNPANDARDVSSLLRAMGFDVLLKTDIDKKGFVDSINEFGRMSREAEVSMFFYAGHGMQVRNVNYLLPVGSNIRAEDEVEFEAVDADRILAKMESADSKVNIVVLDACRDNPFSTFRSSSRGLAPVQAVQGSVIVYATAPGNVAADGVGRNSPFTRHLLQHLDTPGVRVEDVFRRVGAGVSGDTNGRQSPWISSSLYEDYYLK